MSRSRPRPTLIVLVGMLLAAHPSPTAAEENAAAARIEAMANRLAKAAQLSVTVDCAYDVLQESGEKIEFGERRQLTLRRPDRIRFDVTRRDGARRGIVFDGTHLTTFDLEAKVFAVVEKPGTTDAALSYYTQTLHMRLPLRELFAADLPQFLKPVLGSARLVAAETVNGVATDHVAFRGDTADVQLWIAREGDPLPQRILVTYRLAAGTPQFAGDFRDWNFNPDLPDSLFTFVPPPGMEKIPILGPGGERPAAAKQP